MRKSILLMQSDRRLKGAERIRSVVLLAIGRFVGPWGREERWWEWRRWRRWGR
jgi:hypothetical protein